MSLCWSTHLRAFVFAVADDVLGVHARQASVLGREPVVRQLPQRGVGTALAAVSVCRRRVSVTPLLFLARMLYSRLGLACVRLSTSPKARHARALWVVGPRMCMRKPGPCVDCCFTEQVVCVRAKGWNALTRTSAVWGRPVSQSNTCVLNERGAVAALCDDRPQGFACGVA
jgi:hypothetical protein